MTGFRENTTLESYNKRRAALIKFTQSIPILHEGESKYGETEQLSLEAGWLRKKSWIRLQHVLLVPISYFWKYDWHLGGHAYDQRLDKASYERLMYLFSMEVDKYESTASVVKHAKSRLEKLASEGNLQNNQGQLFGIQQSTTTSMFHNPEFGVDKETPINNRPTKHVYPHRSYVAQQDPTTRGGLESGRNSDVNKLPNSYSTLSQLPRMYSPAHMYPSLASGNTQHSEDLDRVFDTAMATNPYSGQNPGYPAPHMPQTGNLYPSAVSPTSQPTVNNNYYSSYNFTGASQNFGMMPGQNMTPEYQQLSQQWQQGLAQQQRALNQYVGHMQSSNGQHAFQQMGQPMTQPPATNANAYNPNAFVQQHLGQHHGYGPTQLQPPNQNRGTYSQPPYRPYRAPYSPNSAWSNFANMRET